MFNASPWISQTLKSVIEQVSHEDEIIVVDDHSTDDSPQKVHTILEASHVSFILAQNKKKGACAARNQALEMSSGNLIQWLDADDMLAPDKITRHRDLLSQNPGSLIVSPFIPFIDNPTSGVIKDERPWDFPHESTPADWLASGAMTIPACWMGYRSTFEKAGPWDNALKVNQDGEFFARAIATADKVLFQPTNNVWYRRGNRESISQFTAEKAESLFSSVDSIHKTALALEDSHRMRQMLANKYQHAIYTAYPHCPAGIEKAQAALRGLPKPTIGNPNTISPLSKGISSIFGWRTLTHLRLLRNKMSS